MRRFVYAPDVTIYIATKNHGVIDVSLDCIDGNVHRVLDAVSTATFTLQNPRNKYIKDVNGDAIFRPMDRVVIFLTRIYKPMQVFSGYLDDVPYDQFIPGPVTFNASCTLKRLLYTYFDPGLTYTMTRLQKFGWTYNPQDGTLQDNSENFFDLDTGGGLGDLIRFMMHEVGGWEISDKPDRSNTVHVMPLPDSFIKKTAKAMANDMHQTDINNAKIETVLRAFMNRSGSEAAGAPVQGGTNADDQPVPAKFEGIYRGSIYGQSMLLADDSGGGGGPKAAAVIKEAKSHLGEAYVYGGETEAGGFDCSGLMQWCYATIGINLPRVAADQYNSSRGTAVAKSALQPADLVFFGQATNIHHVGMYLGNGNFIHAPHTGDVIKISSLNEPYYVSEYFGAKRFIHESVPVSGGTTGTSDILTHEELMNLWVQAGGSAATADVAAAIAQAESGGKVSNLNSTPPDYSVGLWQINYYGPLRGPRTAAYGTPELLNSNALANAKAAVSIASGGANFGPWSTYTSGAYLQYLTNTGPTGNPPPAQTPSPDLAGSIGDVQVPTGFPIGTTFQISPNPYGSPDIVFRAIKTNAKLASNQISMYVPGAIDDSSDEAKTWHQAGTHNVVVDSSTNNGDGAPFAPANPTTVQASQDSFGIRADNKPYDPEQVIGESQDTFLDLYNIAQGEIIGNSITFPTATNVALSEVLTGQRALYNDVPLIKWVETACTASGRRFQSRPDGDFLAFYPDYFGWANDELYSMPYLRISDLEIISGDITLSDHDLTTHYFTTVDANRTNSIDFQDQMETLVASVENTNALAGFTNLGKDFDYQTFLKRYGPRPFVDEQPMIKHQLVGYLYGWQHFLLKWAKQFNCRLETTFLPEIYPGGLIEVSSKGVIMFVESVTHSWSRESGFTTSAELIAPSTTSKKNDGMVLAG